MSHITSNSYFPLNKKCSVRFKGSNTFHKGVFKKMVTKNEVIFFADISASSRIAKIPGSGGLRSCRNICILTKVSPQPITFRMHLYAENLVITLR